MESQPERSQRIQITKKVFDGLELIRTSGLTNMLDRPVVLHLAREWDLTETAEWIERVDTGTYGRLILQGPDVIGNELAEQDMNNHLASQIDEGGAIAETEESDVTEMAVGPSTTPGEQWMMEKTIREQVAEVLVAAGADAVHDVPVYVGHFGDRRVEVRVLDFGPLFERRYEVQLKGEDGTTITVGPASTIATCLQAADWQAVLFR